MKPLADIIGEVFIPKPGTQKGSNPGGIHHDSETGEKHYVKYYGNGEQAKTEALTAKIYHHMGIHTLQPEHHEIGGQHAVATKWNEHLKPMKPHEFESLKPHQQKQIGKMYHAAVLTKNWDVVGLEHDNIVQHKHTGDLYSVDQGGSFHFRARGGPKEYGPDIGEHHSLRHTPPGGYGNASAHVFSTVFKQNPKVEMHGLEAVKKIDDNHIHHLFKTSGLKNWKELHSNFQARKQKLLDHYKGG